ncbi:MAG: hypothetical protein AB7E47_02310 [Desulfovibrionaceae bacterium]
MVKRPGPTPIPFEVTIDGKTFKATYTLDRGMVQVKTMIGEHFRDIATQQGNSPPESIARMLLREIVDGMKRT